MRIAVMAAGAVGAYFGGRLAAAGHDVAFIARGASLAALRTQGLRLESTLGDLTLPQPVATDDPGTIGPVDVVLFAVKLWDTEVAARQVRPLVGPQTRLITLQNGVDAPQQIAAVLGAGPVVAGSAYIATVIASPGVIRHTSPFARLVFGRLDGSVDPVLDAFAEAARAAGIDAVSSRAMDRELWQKFVFLVGLSGATAATRSSIGPILADADTRALFLALMQETVAVARASGVDLPADYADERLAYAGTVPPGMKASQLHDLERGGRLELDWLAGSVVARGRALGVPTPMNEAVYAVLKLHRNGRPG